MELILLCLYVEGLSSVSKYNGNTRVNQYNSRFIEDCGRRRQYPSKKGSILVAYRG